MTTDTLTYSQEIEEWQAEAEANLRADDGWLTLAGLFWLHEGVNTVGSDETSDVVLPAPAPARLGDLHFTNGGVTFAAAPAVDVTVNGKQTSRAVLHADTEGTPDVVRWQALSFLLIKRGERTGIRLRDNNSTVRHNFGRRVWFPIDETFRFDARFVPYDPPKTLAITNILGDTSDTASPGYVEFEYERQIYRLDATSLGPHGLGVTFRDATSGIETYGALRSLTVAAPDHGRVTLDFNRAVNPPCAFTAYATCPLPPRQNKLPFLVRAGERYGAKRGE